VTIENQIVSGLIVKRGTRETNCRAAVIIDATGRSRALSRKLMSHRTRPERRPMVAFKAHFEDAQIEPGACEIYFYRRGYGGLSSVENGLSNLCFIASARDVRANGADAERVVREVVCQNRRAAYTLKHARVHSEWLAVSLEGFGSGSVAPANGLLTIGDAASFIDPFTGSGMLMALESGELVADTVADFLDQQPNLRSPDELRSAYANRYHQRFDSRLKLSALLRRAAFVPGFAAAAIALCGTSDSVRRKLAQATRGSRPETSTAAMR